jgi:hypothetical protein
VSPAEILDALTGHLQLLADTPSGDALVDLLALALPGERLPPRSGLGWGDDWPTIRPTVESILVGWDMVSRQNQAAAQPWREGARAVRACIRIIEEGARA